MVYHYQLGYIYDRRQQSAIKGECGVPNSCMSHISAYAAFSSVSIQIVDLVSGGRGFKYVNSIHETADSDQEQLV
jgi:hypothetical protein